MILGQSLIGPVFLFPMRLEDSRKPRPGSGLLSLDNPLLAMAGMGKLRLPQSWLDSHGFFINKIAYPIAVFGFALLAPQFAAVLGLPFLLPVLNINPARLDLRFALLLVGTFLPLFFLVWLWLRIVEQRPLWTTGMTKPVLMPYLRGLLIGFLLFSGVVLILGVPGFLALEPDTQSGLDSLTLAGILFVFVGWIVQGAAEELLTRGFLMPIISTRWGPLAGVVLSALLFSILHLQNPNVTLVSIINLFLFGLFAALYALAEGQIWGIFAMHAVWNWAQGNLFGFEVSGLDMHSSILIDLMEVGPDWITGGAFGPEGGLAVTLLLLGGSGLVVLWHRGQRASSSGYA